MMNDKLSVTLYREDYTDIGWKEICKDCQVSIDAKEVTIEFTKKDVNIIN